MKAIIFDMDGVLVLSEVIHFNAWQQVFLKLSLPEDSLDFKNLIGYSDRSIAEELIEKYSLSYSNEELCKLKCDFFFAHKEKFESPIGRDLFIESLKELKLPIAVVSNSTRAEINFILQRENILHHFDVIVGCDDIPNPKPHPDPYLLALKKLNIKSDEALVIEDSITGMTAALAANIKVIGLATTSPNLSLGNVQICNNFIEVANAIELKHKEKFNSSPPPIQHAYELKTDKIIPINETLSSTKSKAHTPKLIC